MSTSSSSSYVNSERLRQLARRGTVSKLQQASIVRQDTNVKSATRPNEHAGSGSSTTQMVDEDIQNLQVAIKERHLDGILSSWSKLERSTNSLSMWSYVSLLEACQKMGNGGLAMQILHKLKASKREIPGSAYFYVIGALRNGNGNGMKMLSTFEEAEAKGVADDKMLAAVLYRLCRDKKVEAAIRKYDDVSQRRQIEGHIKHNIRSILITFLNKALPKRKSELEKEIERIYDEAVALDGVAHPLVLTAYIVYVANRKSPMEALSLWQQLCDYPDVGTDLITRAGNSIVRGGDEKVTDVVLGHEAMVFDLATYNSLLSRASSIRDANEICRQLMESGFRNDKYTWRYLFEIAEKEGNKKYLLDLLSQMDEKMEKLSPRMAATAMRTLAADTDVKAIVALFNKLRLDGVHMTVGIYHAMFSAFRNRFVEDSQGTWQRALTYFEDKFGEDGLSHNPDTLHELLSAYATQGRVKDVMKLVEKSSGSGVMMREKTIAQILHSLTNAACSAPLIPATSSAFESGGSTPTTRSIDIFDLVARKLVETAFQHKLAPINAHLFGCYITCLSRFPMESSDEEGLVKESQNKISRILEALRLMDSHDILPTTRMLNTVLYSLGGRRCEALATELFNTFKQEFGVEPDTYTYTLLIRMCSFSYPGDAVAFYEEMRAVKIQPNEFTFLAMFICCHRHRMRDTLGTVLSDIRRSGIDLLTSQHTAMSRLREFAHQNSIYLDGIWSATLLEPESVESGNISN